MTDREKEYIRLGRHKARTDLIWLCNYILGFDKVNQEVHGPMTSNLQKFGKQGEDRWDDNLGRFVYTPPASDPKEVYEFDDERRNLILAPRSWYKTSVNVVGHTVQWILNFPDITILLMHASQETIEKMLVLLKIKFWRNPAMRYFFPEFCPPESAKEFGTQTFFNTPARQKWTASPTVMIAGIESIRTGMHFHVVKFTDIVDEKNAATKEQCEKIVYMYSMCGNLLISPLYWIDVEGTRYNFSDLYGRMIDRWVQRHKNGEKQDFHIFLMSCYKRDVSELGRETQQFSPEETECPYMRDKNGDLISLFPAEWPVEKLQALQSDPTYGAYLFSCQQENNPISSEDADFSLKMLRWKDPEDIARVPGVYYLTTVDTGETQNTRSDPTVITTALVDRMNRKYVVDIQRGKFKPDEIVKRLFATYLMFKPLKVKVEETSFTRGLKPAIQRQSQMTGVYPPFEYLKRETQVSKQERIRLTLQPMLKEGVLFFSTGLSEDVKTQLKFELVRFPRYIHDDILDTLADLYQNEIVSGALAPSKSMEELLRHAEEVMYRKIDQYDTIFGNKEDTKWSSWTGLGGL